MPARGDRPRPVAYTEGAGDSRRPTNAMTNDATLPLSETTARRAAEDELQLRLLEEVSRTFALTIPELPPDLARVVANAYLLCRLVDTIEDEPGLTTPQKRVFCERFQKVVSGREAAGPFAGDLAPLLTDATLPGERELVQRAAQVLAITASFIPAQRGAIERCIRIMAAGMAGFQELAGAPGLKDDAELDRYCYHVAGVVGEMLTELFCLHSPAMAVHRDELMPLAVSFGEGLQLTNILKDIWEDERRGACWLPRERFAAAGFDLADLGTGRNRTAFRKVMRGLVGKARAHLEDAVRYSLLVPRSETGVRIFCLWAVGMAFLTLRRIARHLDFSSGAEVKISRGSVRMVRSLLGRAAARDLAIRILATAAAFGIPRPEPPPATAPGLPEDDAAPSATQPGTTAARSERAS